MRMRFGAGIGALLALAVLVSTAQATSIAKPADHDPAHACSSVNAVLDAFNSGDVRSPALPTFLVHDDFGKVGWKQRPALVHAVTHSDGKRDREPMKLDRLYRLDDGKNPGIAIYVAHVTRVRYRLYRWVPIGMGTDELINDPHWERSNDYWLVRFDGVFLREMRQGDFYWLGRTGKRVDENCSAPVVPIRVDPIGEAVLDE